MMDDDSLETNREQLSTLGVIFVLGLVGMYVIVLLLFIRWPDLVALFFLVGCVPGAAIGALFTGRHGALIGVLIGGALGPILWILGIMWVWSGVK